MFQPLGVIDMTEFLQWVSSLFWKHVDIFIIISRQNGNSIQTLPYFNSNYPRTSHLFLISGKDKIKIVFFGYKQNSCCF